MVNFSRYCPGTLTTRYIPPGLKFRNDEKFPAYIFDMERKRWYFNERQAVGLGLWDAPLNSLSDASAPSGLTSYQERALKRLLEQKVLLAAWDMGIGKSRLAVEASKIIKGKTLILAPRMMVERGWVNELHKWAGVDVSIWKQEVGKPAPEAQPAYCIVSYDSIHYLPAGYVFDFIVLDELHYLMHDTSARSKKILALIDSWSAAYRLGLTGTPFGTAVHDVHSQLSVLSPKGWGYPGVFKDYFFESDNGGYEDRKRYFDLKPSRVAEFADYIGGTIDVATTADAAHLMPEVVWSLQWMDNPSGKIQSTDTLAKWTKVNQTLINQRIDGLLQLPLPEKKTAYITYSPATADCLADRLKIPAISGTISPKKRFKILDDAHHVICTMRSINEGIDLREFSNVVVVELYPVPRYVLQCLARFARMGATESVTITLMLLKGTHDEIIAPALLSRLQSFRMATESGVLGTGLLDLLTIREDDESFLEDLRASFLAITDVNEEEYDC